MQKRMVYVTSLMGSLCLVLSMIAPVRSATAQGGPTTYTSELSGVAVTYGPEFIVDPDGIVAEDGVEIILMSTDISVVSVGFLDPTIPIGAARDIFIETMAGESGSSASIDIGDYGEVSYSLDMLNLDGTEFGMFTLVLSGRSHGFSEFAMLIAPASVFTQAMQQAQGGITINGEQAFNGIDAAVMGQMVVDNVGITGGTEGTDVPAPTSAPDATNETETQPTTQAGPTAESVAGLTPEQGAYLDTVQAEVDSISAQYDLFLSGVQAISDEDQTNNDQGSADIQSVLEFMANYDTAETLTPPAGMEAVHEAYRQYVTDFLNMGGRFVAWLEAPDADSAAALDEFIAVATEDVPASHDAVNAAIANARAGAEQPVAPTEPPAEPTAEPQETDPTAVPDSGLTAEEEAWLDTVYAESSRLFEEQFTFMSAISVLSDGDTSNDTEARTTVDTLLASWESYTPPVDVNNPPAGMEDINGTYVSGYQHLQASGAAFLTAVGGSEADFDANYQVFIDETNAALTDLANTMTMIDERRASSTPVEPTEEPEPTDEPGPTEEPEETEEPTQEPEQTEEPTEEPEETAEPTEEVEIADPEELGLEGDDTWVGPVNGYEVTWDRNFDINVDDDPISVDQDQGSESVLITWDGSRNNRTLVGILPNQNLDARGWEESLSDESTAASLFSADEAEIRATDSSSTRAGAIYLLDGSDYGIVEIRCLDRRCNDVITITTVVSADDAIDWYHDAEEGIMVDGESVAGVFSDRELAAALEE